MTDSAQADTGLTIITAAEMAASSGAGGTAPSFRTPAVPVETMLLAAQDGECRAHVFEPAGAGPWPGILFLMDGFGMRPNIMEMAQRLADDGYVVLLPDLFYRRGPYAPLDVGQAFAGGNMIEAVRDRLGTSPTLAMVLRDAGLFIDTLRGHSDVAGTRIGVTGYCMSGGMSLAIAGTFPEAVAAAACFHGGLLVSPADDSPHRIAPAARARLYVGGAQTDQWCPPTMVAEFDQALTAAGVDHRCEIYEGTLHGWTMRDSPLYDAPAAERHWQNLSTLFGDALTVGDTTRG